MSTSESNLSFRNFWYIACQSHELGAKKPIHRQILDEWLVLFRDNKGKPRAFQDRCIHRNFQLSKGWVKNGELQCPYHGWTYDGKGVVSDIPAEGEDFKKINSRCATTYECVEQDDLIYVRLERNNEYPSSPFRMPHYNEKNYKTVRLFNVFKNNVTNCAENYVDVPHTVFVHDKIFRESRKELVEAQVERHENMVKVSYLKETNNLGWFSWFLNPKGTEITHNDYFYAPNITSVEYIFSPNREFYITSQTVPISEWECHVYTDLTFNFGMFNFLASPIVRYQGQSVIDQDLEILENQSVVIKKYGESFNHSKADIVHVFIESIRNAIAKGKDPRALPAQKKDFRFWL